VTCHWQQLLVEASRRSFEFSSTVLGQIPVWIIEIWDSPARRMITRMQSRKLNCTVAPHIPSSRGAACHASRRGSLQGSGTFDAGSTSALFPSAQMPGAG
jgi:hypothetical protein